MSYHISHSRPAALMLAPARPQQYPLIPLSQAPSALAPTGLDAGTKRVLIVVGILLLALIVFSMFGGKKAVVRNHRPVKRVSTPELAKNLYERLERRGGANETTMRSLKSYASKR